MGFELVFFHAEMAVSVATYMVSVLLRSSSRSLAFRYLTWEVVLGYYQNQFRQKMAIQVFWPSP